MEIRVPGEILIFVRDRKKAGEIVEIVQNQKDGRQIAPSCSPLKDLSIYGEVGDLTAVNDGYGKSDAHLPRFFSVSRLILLMKISGLGRFIKVI
jgi:hypothetical protein